MLDGHFKHHIDRFWETVARSLVKLNLSPNQVTWLGLILLAINCAFYLYHQNPLIFGIILAFTLAFDALDGAVARLTDSQTRYGGYLDAVLDRYQEILIFSSIAFVTGYWAECFFAMSASLLISYNKARAAMEIEIDNNDWPDLMERLERVIIICLCLVLDPFTRFSAAGHGSLYAGLLLIAVLGYITSIQRFIRARQRINDSQ